MSADNKSTLRLKCAVLGNAGVGKTAIVQMFNSDGTQFPKNYSMTVQSEVTVKVVNIPDSNTSVEIFLHDIGGHEIFSEYVPRYCDGASAFAIIYDVTNAESFEAVSKWLQIAKKARIGKSGSHHGGVLVANKTDAPSFRRVVSKKHGEEFARAHKMPYFEISASENEGVDAPFYYISNWFFEHYEASLKAFAKVTDGSR